MGVKGLWTLLEPAGYPISLESLEGKVIAVDISIWLNQSIKGIRDKRGILAENAHLLGLFNRICKLLFYKIKPIFVFDGGVPALKRQTIEERRLRRENTLSKAKGNVNKVLKTYLSEKLQKEIEFEEADEESSTLNEVGLGLKEWTAKDEANLYILPEDFTPNEEKDKEEDNETDWQHFAFASNPKFQSIQDPALIDTESDDFKSLPPEIRHEILSSIRETKKKLNKVENIPTNTGDFSNYQMKRILMRRKIQEKMEEAEIEMVQSLSSKAASNFEDENYQGITAQRVMSDDATHYILMNKRKIDEDEITKKLLMPKKRKEESERKFCPKKAYRDIYGSVDDFDFGIKEETQREGSSTTLREKLKASFIKGPTLKIQFQKNRSKSNVPLVIGKSGTVKHSESESESDEDFVPVEEIEVAEDEEDGLPSVVEESKLLNDSVNKSEFIDADLINLLEEPFTEEEDTSHLHPSPAKKQSSSSPLINDNQDSQISAEKPSSNKFLDPKPSTSKEADLQEAKLIYSSQSTSTNSSLPSIISSPSSPLPSNTVEVSSSPQKSCPSKTRAEILKSIQKMKDALNQAEPGGSSPTVSVVSESQVVNKPIKVEIVSTEDEDEDDEEKDRKDGKSRHFDVLELTPTKNHSKVIDSGQQSSKSMNNLSDSKKSSIQEESSSPKKKLVSFEKGLSPSNHDQQVPVISPIKVLSSSDKQDSFDKEMKQMKKAERQTSTVAQNMIGDCRELLSLFGIPYVMSPMEAEAQCAALEVQGFTQGTITEDSDIWLFGGKTVFKNFFNQSKFVEMYCLKDIEEKLNLDRETMICVSLLTGCDYTDGVEGVGPVKALEILSEFPGKGLDRLKTFKEWWKSKTKGPDKSPGSKRRSTFLKLKLSETFPSDLVYQAFISPIVLDSTEEFSWGMPDLDLLRRYASEKMRWSKERIDGTLVPIIAKLNEKQSQLRIDQFIKLRSNTNKMVYSSKRLADAVNKISGASEPVVEALGTDKTAIPMSKLREKVKNQRKKGKTAQNDSNNKSKQTKRNQVGKKQVANNKKVKTKNPIESEFIQLSESSSGED